jgi:hypothetical protein
MRHLLFVCLLVAGAVRAQTVTYADHQIRFDDARQQCWLVPAGKKIHLWTWTAGELTVGIYDQALRFEKEVTLPGRNPFPSFLNFGAFYYLVSSNLFTTNLFRIEPDGRFDNRTTALEEALGGPLGRFEILAGTSHLFFISQRVDTVTATPLLSITVLDSGLRNRVTTHRSLATPGRGVYSITTANDDLVILERAIRDSVAGLSLSRYEVAADRFQAVYVFPEGLLYQTHRLLVNGGAMILQSSVREPGIPGPTDSHTYLLWLNAALGIGKSLYLHDSVVVNFAEPGFLFRPAMTVGLAAGGLLLVDLGRQAKKEGELLRFTRIDRAGSIASVWKQASDKGAYLPVLLFQNGEAVHAFYVEKLRRKQSLVYTYEVQDTIVNERPVPLSPRFRYAFDKAVQPGPDYFVMPYFDSYRVGLVRVNLRGK